MRTTKVRFASEAGHELAGLLDEPEDREPIAWALFAHCFTCGKSLTSMKRIAEELAREGISLLRFDFTGIGESEGEFAHKTFASNVGDLEAAAGFLARERQPPSVIIGHSLGGAAVIAAAPLIESTRCVATIAAPAHPAHVKRLFTSADFDASGESEVSIGGRPFRISQQFMRDLDEHDVLAIVSRMNEPLLIFHAPTDRIVGIENAEQLFKAARHPRSFVSLGQADHLLSDERDARFVGRVLAAWATRYFA